MGHSASEDWVSGISESLRGLAAAGADDEELGQFIQARKVGDSDLANRILRTQRPPTMARGVSDLGGSFDGVLNQLRVAALKPVVNKMDARVLHLYVQYMWHVSEQIVKAHKDEQFWFVETAVAAVADVVMRFSLDQLSATVDLLGPTTLAKTDLR